MISNKVPNDERNFKDFMRCKDDNDFKPLCIMFPKMSGCVECFDETKYIYFLIEGENLLKAYNKVWDKIVIIMQKRI